MAAVYRAIFGYCFLIFVVRIVGRRPGRQLTPFEYVLIFFMGGVTLTSMVGDDRSLANALIQVTTIAGVHMALTQLKLWFPSFGRIIDGTPLVLLEKGQLQLETMQKMRIQEEDIIGTARDQGIGRADQIDYAVLERNGEISVVPTSQE